MRRALWQAAAAFGAAALLVASSPSGAASGAVEVLDGADRRGPAAGASKQARGVVVIRGSQIGGPLPPPRAEAPPPAPPAARDEPAGAAEPTVIEVYTSQPLRSALWWLPLWVPVERSATPAGRSSWTGGLRFGPSPNRSERPMPARSSPAPP